MTACEVCLRVGAFCCWMGNGGVGWAGAGPAPLSGGPAGGPGGMSRGYSRGRAFASTKRVPGNESSQIYLIKQLIINRYFGPHKEYHAPRRTPILTNPIPLLFTIIPFPVPVLIPLFLALFQR